MKQRRVDPARSNSTLWRPLVGLLLLAGVARLAEAGGTVITDISGRAYAMVIDSSGRIVTGDSLYGSEGFALVRYNSDGSLDTTFGNGGLVITDISGAGRGVLARALAMDSLGRSIVAGSSYPLGRYMDNNDFLLARYNSVLSPRLFRSTLATYVYRSRRRYLLGIGLSFPERDFWVSENSISTVTRSYIN